MVASRTDAAFFPTQPFKKQQQNKFLEKSQAAFLVIFEFE